MPVLRDIGLLATCADGGGAADLGAVEEAALAWRDGRVAWAGPEGELPRAWDAEPSRSAGGAMVVPGLIDAHTKASLDRLDGRLAKELHSAQLSLALLAAVSLGACRGAPAATEDELVGRARGFLRQMLRLGVTTVEAKSGYGLSLEEERKQLRVYRRLDEDGPIRVVATLLAAHALPEAFADVGLSLLPGQPARRRGRAPRTGSSRTASG